MGDGVTSVILEKGGLLGALLIAAVIGLAWLQRNRESDNAASRKQIDDLQAARVADAQKTRDDVVAVNRSLIEVMTLNRAAMVESTECLRRVYEALERGGAPEPTPEPDRTSRRRPLR